MQQTVALWALQRAVHLLGGVRPLAVRLKVSRVRIDMWLKERAPVPGDVFVVLTDILLDHDMEQLREAARSQPANSPSALAQIAGPAR